MRLFFYKLKGSSISKVLAFIIGFLGFFSGIISSGVSDIPILPVLIWCITALAVATTLLSFCHFKNQEKMVGNMEEIVSLLERIDKNTKATHKE